MLLSDVDKNIINTLNQSILYVTSLFFLIFVVVKNSKSFTLHDLSTNIRLEICFSSGGLNFAKQVPIKMLLSDVYRDIYEHI